MTIRIHNHSDHPFRGWLRVPIDSAPPWSSSVFHDGTNARLAIVGAMHMAVDLAVKLDVGQAKVFDLDAAIKVPAEPLAVPADPVTHFGGPLTVGGVPLQVIGMAPTGAAVEVHCRGIVGGVVWNVWLLWYPGEGHATGEVLAIYSDPTNPGMVALADHEIRFGDSVCIMPGAGFKNRVIDRGEWLADGQGRAVPVVFAWPRLGFDLGTVSALAGLTIGAVGRDERKDDPRYPKTFQAFQWASGLHGASLRRLHTWDWALIGPTAKSGVSGAQEEQGFTRGEPMLGDGVGCEQVIYASALKMAERPCHHCEADGTQLDPETHNNPLLIMWDGRPNRRAAPDTLGKTRDLFYDDEAHGRAGPDVEHWLFRTLVMAAHYRHSHACQYLLRQQALNYLRQWTVTPGWSTSQSYASRAMGWEAQAIVLLDRVLYDRKIANRIRLHWKQRMQTITIPWIRGRKYWDVRVNDPRLGPGEWWMPWQQSVGAYWMDVAGEKFDLPELREACLHGAMAVVEEAWVELPQRIQGVTLSLAYSRIEADAADGRATEREHQQKGNLTCHDATGYCLDNDGDETWVDEDPDEPGFLSVSPTSRWAPRPIAPVIPGSPLDPSFTYFGMALAPAVMLRNGKLDDRVQRLWKFLVDNASDAGQMKWLAPEVLP